MSGILRQGHPKNLTGSSGFVADMKSVNGPAFHYYKSSSQTISSETNTAVTFETKVVDTHNTITASGNKFTPGIAGYYFISLCLAMTNYPAGKYIQYRERINGSYVWSQANYSPGTTSDFFTTISYVHYFDENDYLEIYMRHNRGSNADTRSSQEVRFSGFRIS